MSDDDHMVHSGRNISGIITGKLSPKLSPDGTNMEKVSAKLSREKINMEKVSANLSGSIARVTSGKHIK